MDIGSDTMVPTASAQVATPTLTQAPVMPTTVPISVSLGEKPEKFSGLNFKRWQQKMLFYFTTLNLARFLTEEAPKLKEDECDIQVISIVDAWKHSDFLCRNYVMNALTDSLYNVYTDKKTAKKLSKSGKYVGKGYMSGGMWKLNVMTIIKSEMNKASSSAYILESSSLWHCRLGHVNYDTLRKLINLNHIPTFQIDANHKCETCVEVKLTRSSFQSIERHTEPLDLIHSDICDLKLVQTRGGNKYFITFVDDSTKYCYVYLLKSKGEAIEKFVLYKNEVENQLNRKIKVLRSDRGGEYESPFVDLCAQHGIIHETTAPYSPQSNRVAERKNRTLKEMMNAMLISSGLPQNMWGEAILSANYLLNKVPKKKVEKTPYELWKGMKPSYKYLRVWGCLAKVAVPPPKKVRIGPITIDCIFIGYAHNSAAYRFLIYESNIPDIHQNTIMESRNASFYEDVFPYGSKEKPSSSERVLETIHENSQDEDTDGEVEPRRSKRARIEKSFGLDFLTYMLEGETQT